MKCNVHKNTINLRQQSVRYRTIRTKVRYWARFHNAISSHVILCNVAQVTRIKIRPPAMKTYSCVDYDEAVVERKTGRRKSAVTIWKYLNSGPSSVNARRHRCRLTVFCSSFNSIKTNIKSHQFLLLIGIKYCDQLYDYSLLGLFYVNSW